MKKITTFFLLTWSFLATAQSPNFVFILADDMGWSGSSLQVSPVVTGSKSDFYETPNLEILASQGMTFSQAYAPAAKCSPTRCSILTGETTARNGFTETGNPNTMGELLLDASNLNSIPTEDVTISEWLSSIGMNYRTAHYGKWHLSSGGPVANGFSHEDGNNSNDAGNAGDGLVVQTDPKKTTDLTNKSITFMQDAVTANEPFYLQVSHYAVHGAIETTQASQDHFTAKTPGTVHDNIDYAGMTKDMDATIGVLLQEIDNLSIAGDTYVIFMSDNGAQANFSNNSPLFKGKGFIFEGGIRVPMIVRGPNIPAGSTSAEPVVGYDIYPTIAEWTGSAVALPTTLDGESIAPVTLQNSFTRNTPLIFHSPHYGTGSKNPSSAAVEGNYKLHIDYETGIDELFDLDANVNENNSDIAAGNPMLVLDLKIKLRDYLKSVNANMPSLNPALFGGTTPDIDADGLVDTWEFTELLSYHFGPTDDPDGDGNDNLTEYNNGTDPLVNEMILAVDESANDCQFLIFPNPNQGQLNLEFLHSNGNNAKITLRILSLNGQLVKTIVVQKSDVLSFEINELRNGIYLVEVLEEERLIGVERMVLGREK